MDYTPQMGLGRLARYVYANSASMFFGYGYFTYPLPPVPLRYKSLQDRHDQLELDLRSRKTSKEDRVQQRDPVLRVTRLENSFYYNDIQAFIRDKVIDISKTQDGTNRLSFHQSA